jgi:hypothetical protein
MNNKKVIAIAIGASILCSIGIQQLVNYSSTERFRRAFAAGQAAAEQESQREQAELCSEYRNLKAGNPSWEPIGDYYQHCY